MPDGAILIVSRRKRLRRYLICVIALLLGGFSMASAEIPLPRPRPADIPADQSRPTTTASQCRQQLAGIAEFKEMASITGPGECVAEDVVALDSVMLRDNHRVVLSPSAVLRCPMAQAVTHWVRDDVAPVIATLGSALRGIETLDSFVCRGRNGATGGKVSEHGRANALDVRAFRLADGRTIGLTDAKVAKPAREDLRQTACRRFTTVLGNGADAFHESHVHLDLLERTNKYKICQWDVLDVAESAALAAKKAMTAANAGTTVGSDVPLPRPRPLLSGDYQRRHEQFREAKRRTLFDFIMPPMKYAHSRALTHLHQGDR